MPSSTRFIFGGCRPPFFFLHQGDQLIIRTEAEFKSFLAWLANQKQVAYDIETNGLDFRTSGAAIVGFGVSSFSNWFYLPVSSYNVLTSQLETLPTASLVPQFLQALQKKELITFNGAFDLPWTKHCHGVDLLPNLHTDVLLLKHTVDEEFPFALKDIAVQVFGYGAAAQQRDLHAQLKERGAAKGEIYKADHHIIGKYCGQDCVLTFKLYQHYLRKLRAEGLESFFYEQEVMPLYKHVTIPMENYGLRLDVPLMQKTLQEISADIEAIERSIQKQVAPLLEKVFVPWFLGKDYPPSRSGNFAQGYCALMQLPLPKTASGKYSLTVKAIAQLPDGHAKSVLMKQELMTDAEILAVQQLLAKADHGDKPLFNLQSKHHLKKLFFDTLGLKPLSTTDLGNPQVDDEFIHSIVEQFAWANDLHIYNRLQKIRSTYIERFLEEERAGIFYPSFFQHRTISGRLAGDFQQLPRPIDDGHDDSRVVKYTNLIRQFFIARPGKIFVDADYNSAEPRVFAYISGDERLKNIFRNGMDFYSEIALRTEKLAGVSSYKKADNYLGKINPAKRQQAKSYALGTPYGLTGYKLAFQLGCSSEEGEKLINGYLNAFPDLKAWMEKTKNLVLDQGYVRTIGGRIRHLSRAKEYHRKYGLTILDSLQLWKDYHEDPLVYEHMKKIRRELKNLINNGSNVQIQAAVATIINLASIRIAAEFTAKSLNAAIVAQIHDQLVIECDEEIKCQVAEIVQRNMESSAAELIKDVPIPAEPNFGHNLKESKGA